MSLRALATILAIAVPLACAGTGEDPEIRDAAGDAGAGARTGDLVAGWFEENGTHVTLTLGWAELVESPPPLLAWYVVLDAANATWALGAFTDLVPGPPLFFMDAWSREANGPEGVRFVDLEGTYEPGAPGTIRVIAEKRNFAPDGYDVRASLPDGTVFSGLRAGAGAIVPHEPGNLGPSAFRVEDFDDATGSDFRIGTFTPDPPAAREGPREVPLTGVGGLAALAVATAGIRRRPRRGPAPEGCRP